MQAAQINMVHESEAQRRHARIRIPCNLKAEINNKVEEFTVQDLSASGFAVQDANNTLNKGDNGKGQISFVVDEVDISFSVKFQVVSLENGRAGCEFHDLGIKEVSTLRLLITKFLSGEVTAVDDVLSTLSRDNFSKDRKGSGSQALSGGGKVKALAGTTIMFAAGLIALSYIVSNLYDSFFLTKAVSGVVSISSESAIAPREGFVKPLVKVGDRVSIGQPIATIDSPLLEMIQPVAAASGMDENELRDVLAKRVGGVIESQCDCIVVDNMINNGKYLLKGETGLKLAPIGAIPVVMAHFEYADLSQITIGEQAKVSLGAGLGATVGEVVDIRLPQSIDDGFQQGTVLVTIKPESELTREMVNRPVVATVGGFL